MQKSQVESSILAKESNSGEGHCMSLGYPR